MAPETLTVLLAAQDALGTAVERYDMMGFFEEDPAGEEDDFHGPLEEANEVMAAMEQVNALVEKLQPEDNPTPELPIDVIARCLGVEFVDVRLSLAELDVITDDAGGMEDTWWDLARNTGGDEGESSLARRKSNVWGDLFRRLYPVRQDLDRRARAAGC